MEKILIVEDEIHISGLVKYNLEKANFECIVAETGESALDKLKDGKIALIILDIMLPGMDGFELCRRIKGDSCIEHIPIIILTAKGEEIDRIVGLELGADDYVVKPFSTRELVLRVKGILKRGNREKEFDNKKVISIGDIKVDIPRHRVTVKNVVISLTHMEFNLLVTLIKRRGRVQTRDVLLSDIWDIANDVTTRTVDTHIKRLRKKMGEKGRLIETVRGIGYRFIED